MNNESALHRIREEFQQIRIDDPPRTSRLWTLAQSGRRYDLLSHALLYLCETMKIDRAAIFMYDPVRHTLVARQLIDHKEVLPGEEEISLVPDSPLARLLDGKRKFLILSEPHPMAYIPLRAFGHIFGALRVEHVRQMKPFAESDVPLLADFSHELATAMKGLEMAASEREQVGLMKALHEVSNAIFRSLRLDEMLTSVSQSLVQQLGFDRVRIYLLNKEGDSLECAITMDQHLHQNGERETFPLKRGIHPMVDMILGRADDERLERYQRTIVFLPLRARDENLGVLMVDNVLSQQEIPSEQMPILTAVAGQLAMAIKNARLFQGVEELSITDGLTGLYLLRYFKQRLREEFFRAERNRGQLSMMILDIDHFKRFNDAHGHPVGDTLLSTVAERVLANARKVDLTARYGGDEFVMLLPDTSADEAMLLADRLHQAVSSTPIALGGGRDIHLTVSIGVATYPTHANTIEELIKRADEALYWVKSHGRNRIRLYSFEIPAKL